MSEPTPPPINRQAVREACYAHARFAASGALAYVLDITPIGCRFVFQDAIHFGGAEIQEVEIMPIEELGIAHFTVAVSMHWDRADKPFHAAGASFRELAPASRVALDALVASFGKPTENH